MWWKQGDRLTAASGLYNEDYAYSTISNIATKNGAGYTYGDAAHKHVVTLVGSTTYAYDANGNMTSRNGQTLTYDAENHLTGWSQGGSSGSFVYDGDGVRVAKTEGGATIHYPNRYYEKNVTTEEVTTYYSLGDRLIALRKGSTLEYAHQDHLGGTAVTTNTSGATVASIKYFPFGATRSSNGALGTDRKYTGQRLDGSGLYFYNARYYDANLGRFVSADTLVPDFANPQSLNRYSYVLNRPLVFVDPWGRDYVVVPGMQTNAKATYEELAKELYATGEPVYFYDWGMGALIPYTDGDDFDWAKVQASIGRAGQVSGADRINVGDEASKLGGALGKAKDIKLVGLSKGAALIGEMLYQMSQGLLTWNSDLQRVAYLNPNVGLTCMYSGCSPMSILQRYAEGGQYAQARGVSVMSFYVTADITTGYISGISDTRLRPTATWFGFAPVPGTGTWRKVHQQPLTDKTSRDLVVDFLD